MNQRQSAVLNLFKEIGVDRLPSSWFEQSSPAKVVESENQVQIEEESVASNTVRVVRENKPPVPVFDDFTLDQLRADSHSCMRCRLCETRNNVVFGVGNTNSPLIAFVGEGPGADEDMKGEPFVGRAGQLLTAAITKGLGLTRETVYICNVVKCRPPENRAPLPDETEACTPYLYRQLELVKPRVIITLGQPAQMALSGVKLGITKLRGQWQEWRGIKLMPTFHPAYLLRNPPAKKPFWEDLQTVMKELGLPIQKGF